MRFPQDHQQLDLSPCDSGTETQAAWLFPLLMMAACPNGDGLIGDRCCGCPVVVRRTRVGGLSAPVASADILIKRLDSCR